MKITKDWFIVLSAILILPTTLSANEAAKETAKLVNVTHQSLEDKTFQTVLTFDNDVSNAGTQVEFINQTVQVDINNASMAKARDHQKLAEDSQVKSLYTYRPAENTVRHRIILNNDQSADIFKEKVDVNVSGNTVTVTLKNETSAEQILKSALPPKAIDGPTVVAATDDMEAELQQAAKATTQEQADATITEASEQTALIATKEEEAKTPLFKTSSITNAKSKDLWQRLLVSIVVLIAAATGLVLFAKWWNRTHKKNPMAGKMEVVSQFHLGPKRTLAIVRVAGEFILIGVTDHNISMIKTLSLIDDEFADQLSQLDKNSDGADSMAKLFGQRSNNMGNML